MNYPINAIETRDLKKVYRQREKAEGLGASFRSLLRPQYRDVEAVRHVSLTVPAGQALAFIGPNGAGKSTMIKMLCGILNPTSGGISVLGMNPQRDRQRLAARIGTVFGQKSQLWLHLPPLDSFSLLAAIYGIDDRQKRARVEELSDQFGLSSFLKTPVRKLSLGQRIRCEVAASLLHDPEILFLDEPTIGLDVVVKQAIRGLIQMRNRQNGTTVFLTSHDPSDIERLCDRAVVIDNGRVVLDSSVDKLKTSYLSRKAVSVSFSSPKRLFALPGMTADAGQDGLRAVLSVDTGVCPIGEVISRLSALGDVLDITVSDPPMEEIIADIFAGSQREADGV